MWWPWNVQMEMSDPDVWVELDPLDLFKFFKFYQIYQGDIGK